MRCNGSKTVTIIRLKGDYSCYLTNAMLLVRFLNLVKRPEELSMVAKDTTPQVTFIGEIIFQNVLTNVNTVADITQHT